MKPLPFAFATCAVALAATFQIGHAQAQTGTDLLENGGFEYMATGLANGNNLNKVPTGWTLSAGEANWQQGSATGTGTTVALAPDSAAYTGGAATTAYNSNTDTGGNHFFDGTNGNSAGFTILYQNFTLTKTTSLTGSFVLGARDAANGTIGAGAGESGTMSGNTTNADTTEIQIINTSTNQPVAITSGTTSSTIYRGDTSQITIGNWETNTLTVPNLAAGTYEFAISLYDSQNIDAVTLVPEPSTWAAVVSGAGLLGLALRRRVARA